MSKKLFCLLFSVFTLGHAKESEELPPPKPPFFVSAPANAAWTVIYKPKNKAAALPADGAATSGKGGAPGAPGLQRTLKEVQVFKAAGNRRMIFYWSDGSTTEKWWWKGTNLFEQPGSQEVNVLNLGAALSWMPGPETFTDTDFPEFRWLQASLYVAESDERDPSGMKRPHYLFCAPKNTASPEASPSAKPLTVEQKALLGNKSNFGKRKGSKGRYGMRAWIDAQTKLPIALDDTVNLLIFTFDPNPPTALELPPRFSDAYKSYLKDTVESLARHVIHETSNK